MLYQIKKITFFLFAIVSIPLLFSWILYDLDSAFHIGSQIGIKLLPDTLFRDDAIILPIFLSLLFPTLGSLIYLIFYRRECSVWPKLLILFTGTVNAFTSLQISSAIFTAQFQDDNSAIGWKLLLAAYAAIALAAIIWLIIAMVKYPKPASKPA